MKLKIQEIENKEIWENFLLEREEKTFLSSWNWGEFNKMMGNKIWRLGVFENNSLISVALVVKIVAKRGSFLLIPHGPVMKYEAGSMKYEEVRSTKYEVLKILLEELKKIGEREKADFIRISPIWEDIEENIKIFQNLGFREAPIHIHPEDSWKLDITPSEEELLRQMRRTTRYLIHRAQKVQNLKIFQSQTFEDIEIFNKIHQEVVNRQHFIPFSLEYFKNEFLAFQPDNQASLFFGKYKEEIIASAYLVFWSNIAFYHHAALLPKYHKIPIAYLLLWEAIKEAKKRGCEIFDFWGFVDPQKKPKHPWAGPTLFKMGFGGNAFEYLKTQDFPLSKKYWLTFLFEKLRKIKRNL